MGLRVCCWFVAGLLIVCVSAWRIGGHVVGSVGMKVNYVSKNEAFSERAKRFTLTKNCKTQRPNALT